MSNIKLGLSLRIPARWRRLAVCVPLVLTTATAYAQSPDPATQAVATFENTTHDYARLHRRLERPIGSIQLGTPVPEINRIVSELAAAIRGERSNAKQGEFFTPALARVLIARINDTLLEHRYTADDVLAAGRVDAVDYTRVALQVNDTFPWVLAVAMLPCLIEALPQLPSELQYRIVGHDLVLIDIHASLIVDILPHALVDRTWR